VSRPDEIQHGHRDVYRTCKCPICRAAVAREKNLYLLRRAAAGGPLHVDKLGAVRRLHALMAIGWPRRELAAHAGYQGDAFALVLNSRRRKISIDTHQRIARLFDELCMSPGPSKSTRLRAAAKGWLPPLAWDDLDDPNEQPSTRRDRRAHPDDVDEVVVERILAGDWRLRSSRAEKEAVVARWTQSLSDLERLTGWKPERYARQESVA
jgi:hypothetical protein